MFRVMTFGAVSLSVLAVSSITLSASQIPLGGGGVLNVANMAGGVVAVTSNAPCIAFSGSTTCAGATTGIDISGTDPLFLSGNGTGTIKDIGTVLPIPSFKTAQLTAGGPAIFDLLSIKTPVGFVPCVAGTASGSCSTGTFVFTQSSDTQVSISFTTNENGYIGASTSGFTPYQGVFTTQLSGDLKAFGCVVSGAQTCTDTISNILIFESTAAQTNALGLGNIGQSGTIKSTWSATESPLTGTPEPVSFLLFGTGLVAVAFAGRKYRRS